MRDHSPSLPVSSGPTRRPAPALGLWWIIAIVASTAVSSLGEIGGIRVSSVGWLVPLVLAALLLAKRGESASGTTALLWTPWVSYITISATFSPAAATLQQLLMLLTPVAVLLASTTVSISQRTAVRLLKALQVLIVFLIVLFAGRWLIEGSRPGFAAQFATTSMLGAIFATVYAAKGSHKSLLLYLCCLALPLLSVGRAALVATALALPLTVAPLSWRRRFLMITAAAVCFAFVFHLPAVQEKLFYDGSGKVSDLMLEGAVNTSGRLSVWKMVWEEAWRKPFLGHGLGAASEFLLPYSSAFAHPHNDYLRIFFELGFVGAALYFLTMATQIVFLVRRSRNVTGPRKYLLQGAITAFVPYFVLMATDNVLLYAAYFASLQFAVVGAAVGEAGKARSVRHVKDREWRKT